MKIVLKDFKRGFEVISLMRFLRSFTGLTVQEAKMQSESFVDCLTLEIEVNIEDIDRFEFFKCLELLNVRKVTLYF